MKDRLGIFLRDWRIRAVLPHVTGRLLDIGCHENHLVRSYRLSGVGVDVHPWTNVDVVVEDTSKLPFADGEFGTVSVVASLNHIPNRADVLREARRVLQPDGRLIVTMIPPRVSAVWHFLRRASDDDLTERGMKPGEVYGLTPREVRQLITDAGFDVVLERPFMFGVNRLTVARRR
jgi:SAM-dependent methyltransferase